MPTTEKTQLYRIDPEQCAWRIVDGEAVLINSETTYYYGLNASATELWRQLLEGDVEPDSLANALAGSLDVDVEELRAHAGAFLDELVAEGLVTQVDGAPETSGPSLKLEFSGPWSPPEITRYNTLEDLILCGE